MRRRPGAPGRRGSPRPPRPRAVPGSPRPPPGTPRRRAPPPRQPAPRSSSHGSPSRRRPRPVPPGPSGRLARLYGRKLRLRPCHTSS
ncbi:hypothetical protein DBP15_26420 [Streptomyces sp. CS065A]|nr:hypothetical protein DBP15_26420 [Streptomyces sp. CS065A]